MNPLEQQKHFMDTQTQNQTEVRERNSSAEMIVGFAILGCLVAGGVGIYKALTMTNGFDVLLCLLGSVTAFGTLFYIFLRRS